MVLVSDVNLIMLQMEHVTVTQGNRPNIILLEVDVAAIKALSDNELFRSLRAKYPMDGIEICFHDAFCYDDPDNLVLNLDTRNDTFSPTDPSHKFNYLSKVSYHCGELTDFQGESGADPIEELEVTCKESSGVGTWIRTDNDEALGTTLPNCVCK